MHLSFRESLVWTSLYLVSNVKVIFKKTCIRRAYSGFASSLPVVTSYFMLFYFIILFYFISLIKDMEWDDGEYINQNIFISYFYNTHIHFTLNPHIYLLHRYTYYTLSCQLLLQMPFQELTQSQSQQETHLKRIC